MKTIFSIIFLLSMLTSSTMIAQVGNNGNNNSDGQTQRRDIVNDGPTMQIPTPEITINQPNPPAGPTTDFERHVFWVHGLKGTSGTWGRAAFISEHNKPNVAFSARKLKSNENFTYTEDALDLAVTNLEDVIEGVRGIQLGLTPIEDPGQNFIIAHSQGGVVSRSFLNTELCYDNLPKSQLGYGGIVTFGTPNQGARIINNKTMFVTMASDMCVSLGGGKIQEALTFNFLGFTFQTVVDIQKLCDQFSGIVVPLITEFETPNITNSYAVGASDLTAINNGCPANPDFVSFPKVAFYGVEPPQNLMLRTVLYFSQSPNESEYFQANDDNALITQFNLLKLDYIAKAAEWKGHYEYAEDKKKYWCNNWVGYIPSPITLPLYAIKCDYWTSEAKKKKLVYDLYQNGVDWFDRFDDQYKAIIGSKGVTLTTKKYCVCKNEITGQKTETLITLDSECESDPSSALICFLKNKITTTKWEKESDGVVLAESASNIPFATAPPQKMVNSSHMQMRNDVNTKTSLNLIYGGDVGFFFKTVAK